MKVSIALVFCAQEGPCLLLKPSEFLKMATLIFGPPQTLTHLQSLETWLTFVKTPRRPYIRNMRQEVHIQEVTNLDTHHV